MRLIIPLAMALTCRPIAGVTISSHYSIEDLTTDGCGQPIVTPSGITSIVQNRITDTSSSLIVSTRGVNSLSGSSSSTNTLLSSTNHANPSSASGNRLSSLNSQSASTTSTGGVPASSKAPISSSYPNTTTNLTLALLTLTQRLRLADTASDRYQLLPRNESFKFDFNASQTNSSSQSFIVADRDSFPALVGTGAAVVVGHVGPCGINAAHFHPHTTELQLVIQGRLITKMALESGVFESQTNRVIENEIRPFQLTTFFEGSSHFQFNPDCTNATFVSWFNDDKFITGYVSDQIYKSSYTGDDASGTYSSIPSSMSQAVEECSKKCKI